MNRQEAIELARKIKEIRRKELSFQTILRLSEMGWSQRQVVMKRLVREGYADSIEDIERMMNSKKMCLDFGVGACPTENTGMSDDFLDTGIQYIDINKNLL